MRRKSYCALAFFTVLLLLVSSSSIACDGNGTPADESETPPPGTTQPHEKVKFTIGSLTDQTGVAASAIAIIDTLLDDMVDYYNEKNLIPGVKLETKKYDTQYDSSLAVTGYQYLKANGADLIWCPVTNAIPVIKPIADKDEFPVFAATARLEVLMPPGYVFSLGTIPQYDAYTLLKWIAENDWDYEKNGPAKIGGAAWSDAFSNAQLAAIKEYAEAHPEQFQWEQGYLTDFKFGWDAEIEGLKDCDYVYPPTPMHTFVASYRAAGYETKFIGNDSQAGFFDMIDKGNYWDEIDGMLFIRGSRWWTEEGPTIDMTKELLQANHGAEAEQIMRSGVGYLTTSALYQLLQIIKNAAEEVGPENLDSQAIYEAAVNYTETIDGIERYNFDDTKRCSTNFYIIYEVDGEEMNLFRADPDWIPVETAP